MEKKLAQKNNIMDLKEKIIAEIRKIYDPEIPVNIYELGLIYDVKVKDNTAKIIEYLRDKYKIEVFFKQNISNERIEEVVREFKSIKGVRSTTIITKIDAKKILLLISFKPKPNKH